MPNSYEDGRSTSDCNLRDDFEDEEPGFISQFNGRLGLNRYSDNDSDDSDADYAMTHCRRNIHELPDEVPDPYFKRG